jgi:hypothetical protein
VRPPSPIKYTGGMFQEVEHLLYKHEAMILNTSPTKKEKKNN